MLVHNARDHSAQGAFAIMRLVLGASGQKQRSRPEIRIYLLKTSTQAVSRQERRSERTASCHKSSCTSCARLWASSMEPTDHWKWKFSAVTVSLALTYEDPRIWEKTADSKTSYALILMAETIDTTPHSPDLALLLGAPCGATVGIPGFG